MMATLIDSPEFTANEIYEIQQTDPVEGAGAGASFSGIGLSNEPHQQLANRTAFLYGRQNTNIANIAALQSFVAGFTGLLKTAGYLKIPLTDVSRGPAVAIIQGILRAGPAEHPQRHAIYRGLADPVSQRHPAAAAGDQRLLPHRRRQHRRVGGQLRRFRRNFRARRSGRSEQSGEPAPRAEQWVLVAGDRILRVSHHA
jgi:hypothetical protein